MRLPARAIFPLTVLAVMARMTRRGAGTTRLALSYTASSHDGPHIDDLVTLGNVVAVEGVGALIKIGAVDLHTVTELRCLLPIFPS